MTNPMTPEEIDERRACEVTLPINSIEPLGLWKRETAERIRQSDEERGFELIDTREYVAVPREMTEAMEDAAYAVPLEKDGEGGQFRDMKAVYAAILAAQEGDK